MSEVSDNEVWIPLGVVRRMGNGRHSDAKIRTAARKGDIACRLENGKRWFLLSSVQAWLLRLAKNNDDRIIDLKERTRARRKG